MRAPARPSVATSTPIARASNPGQGSGRHVAAGSTIVDEPLPIEVALGPPVGARQRQLVVDVRGVDGRRVVSSTTSSPGELSSTRWRMCGRLHDAVAGLHA